MDDLIRLLMIISAYLAGIAGLALVVLRFTAGGRSLVQRLIGGQEVWFAFAAAALMTASSLTLSEVFHFLPCRWCWIQRGFAYPNVLVLGVTAVWRKRAGWWLALPLASLGIAASTYHILLDLGVVPEGTSCDVLNPCTTRWQGFEHGWGTIQVGAFCCFLFIIGLGLHVLAKPSESPAEAD